MPLPILPRRSGFRQIATGSAAATATSSPGAVETGPFMTIELAIQGPGELLLVEATFPFPGARVPTRHSAALNRWLCSPVTVAELMNIVDAVQHEIAEAMARPDDSD